MIIRPPGHPYESPDYIEQALREFKNRDWTGKPFDYIISEYRDTFVTVPICHIKIPKGTVLFRGRKNERDKVFTHLDQIGLKSKDKVHTFGRANIPGEAVFYACTNEETVVREVTQWYINDNGRAQDLISRGIMGFGWNPFTTLITISAWYVKEDLHLALLFNAEDNKRPQDVQNVSEKRKNPGIGDSRNYHKSFHMILDFFSSEFGKLDVKNELEYIYSAYYAYEIYHQTNKREPAKKLDGVKYASIANDCRGENIAICEASFRKKIAFLGANFCCAFNSIEHNIEGRTAITGRIETAVLKNDNSFDWVNAEEGTDYIIKVNGKCVPFVLPSDGSKLKKAVVRIGL